MKKLAFFTLCFWIFTACEPTPEAPEKKTQDKDETPGYLTEQEITRFIEAQLRITGNEKYTVQSYYAELNADDSTDRIIAVNLLDRAKNEAISSGKIAKMAETGYTGEYNYFFYVDGQTQMITSPIAVPSSAMADIKISFENITSEAHKDVQVDYRVMNDCYRKYYTIIERIPVQVSETEIFQNLGKDDEKAFFVVLEPSQQTIARNIVVYKGIAEDYQLNDPDDVYKVTPIIKSTDELIRRWYYSPVHQKYYLKKSEL